MRMDTAKTITLTKNNANRLDLRGRDGFAAILSHWHFCFVKEPTMSIYFIQCGTNGPIKIGYTNKDVKERVAQLQTACPYELKLLWVTDGDQESEQFIHERLKHENIRGEWFRPGKDIIEEIESSDNEYTVNLHNFGEISILESVDGEICFYTPLGEIILDLKKNTFKINPVKEKPEVLINKWWTRVVR